MNVITNRIINLREEIARIERNIESRKDLWVEMVMLERMPVAEMIEREIEDLEEILEPLTLELIKLEDV